MGMMESFHGRYGSFEESRSLREIGTLICSARQCLNDRLGASVFVSHKALAEPVAQINPRLTLHYSMSRRRLLTSSVE